MNNSVTDFLREGFLLHTVLTSNSELLARINKVARDDSVAQMAINLCHLTAGCKTERGMVRKLTNIFPA